MVRLFLKIALLLILLTIGLSSCVNLKHVSDFSSSSLAGLKKFEEIDYGFKQNCLENCQEKKIIVLSLSAQECNCEADQKADNATLLIYHAVKGYLDGLNRLSENNLTKYKTDALTKALTDIDIHAVQIEKTHVEAYTNISGILLDAFTNKYRKRKIKEYLRVGNEPVMILIRFLDFNLSANLVGKLDVQKQRMKEDYFDFTKDSTLSNLEKRKVVEEYYQRTDKIEAKQAVLRNYSLTLKKIAGGHQELVDNMDKISRNEIIDHLTQYVSDLQDLSSEFNKIVKK